MINNNDFEFIGQNTTYNNFTDFTNNSLKTVQILKLKCGYSL